MLNHAMRYVIIIIGCLLAAAAYNLFLIPMKFFIWWVSRDCLYLVLFI